MEHKIFEQYLYKGLGFPVLLLNVPMVKFDDDWALDLDHELLERGVLLRLCQKSSSLKGNEIKFIRTFFSKTLQQFGDQFRVTPACVKKWEDRGDQFTSMHETTEKMIRLFVLNNLLPEKFTETQTLNYRENIKKLIDQHFTLWRAWEETSGGELRMKRQKERSQANSTGPTLQALDYG